MVPCRQLATISLRPRPTPPSRGMQTLCLSDAPGVCVRSDFSSIRSDRRAHAQIFGAYAQISRAYARLSSVRSKISSMPWRWRSCRDIPQRATTMRDVMRLLSIWVQEDLVLSHEFCASRCVCYIGHRHHASKVRSAPSGAKSVVADFDVQHIERSYIV